MKTVVKMKALEFVYEEGWYGEETDGRHPFRWMSRTSACTPKYDLAPGKKYLVLTAGHSFPVEDPPLLEVFAKGIKIGERRISSAFSSYIFSFEAEGAVRFEFTLDRIFRIPSDTRELGIMVRDMNLVIPGTQEDIVYGDGWYEWESGEIFPFRWMSRQARVLLPSPKTKREKYLVFAAFSEYADMSQKLLITSGSKTIAELPLLYQWNHYSVLLPLSNAGKEASHQEGTNEDGLVLSVNKLFPGSYHPEDSRDLSIRVGPFEFDDDDQRHDGFLFFHKNALQNFREMEEGITKLSSFPRNLGVDLFAKCNMKPPCVYCLWDRMKELEGEDEKAVVDEKTLIEYGPFFTSARTVVNCSFGEPLLHPRLQEILDFCKKNRKIVELSTNGQAFTPRTIKALAGKPVYLYISFDAATRETYARIRNDQWDAIIPNLIELNEERKKRGNLPKIFMVFMPMKVNKHELEDYFRLCLKIDADAFVLRPLLYLENPNIRVERAGYVFDYGKELLGREEVEKIFRQCDEFSKKYSIPVANQYNFGVIRTPGSKGV